MIEIVTSAINRVKDASATVSADYDVVRDDEGNLLRDEDGKPMRDARDLPPATEPSHLNPNVEVRIARGRELPAANDRPDTTYKVAHIDVDTDYDFDDTFGQYYAVNRAKTRRNTDMDAFRDLHPTYLTDLEQIKQLETQVGRLAGGEYGHVDVDAERVSPIAFRLDGVDDEAMGAIRRHATVTLQQSMFGDPAGCVYYGLSRDGDSAYLWARHVYSYPDWRDLDEEYDSDSEE